MTPAYVVHGVSVALVDEINSPQYDALVVLIGEGVPPLAALEDFVAQALELDAGLGEHAAVLPCARVSGGRLVLAPLGPLTPYDDVRSVAEAARTGLARALAAGATAPALALQPHARWPRAALVALLGALEALHVPLQIRETFPERAHRVRALGVYGEGLRAPLPALLQDAAALEEAR